MALAAAHPLFLRIPPFPRHKGQPLAVPGSSDRPSPGVIATLRAARVGGKFWGERPSLTPGTRILAPGNREQLQEMIAAAQGDAVPLAIIGPYRVSDTLAMKRLSVTCDPWYLAETAGEIWAGADQELSLVAGLCDTPLRLFGAGRFEGVSDDPVSVAQTMLAGMAYHCPFSGEPWPIERAIEQLADWRQLIDANRSLVAVYGVAHWKRVTVDAALWGGTGAVPYSRTRPKAHDSTSRCIAWKSRTKARLLEEMDRSGFSIGELEDGFIRSVGLGANCVPPLSIIIDYTGIYFDSTKKAISKT